MFPEVIYDTILSFILLLTGDPPYPRNLVQVFVDCMDDFNDTVYIPNSKIK